MSLHLKPSAYLVGAPKAGSSALASFLAQHPEIALPAVKETNFHCGDLTLPKPSGEREYLSLFNAMPETRTLLDASILSLYSQAAAESIYRYCPTAKIIMILRNPVHATQSWHAQMVFTGNEPIADFERAFAAEASRKRGKLIPPAGTAHNCPQLLYYSQVMRYGEQVQRFLSIFPRDQILVLLHDDLLTSPQWTCDCVTDFLGVSRFTARVNQINTYKVRRFARFYLILKRLLAEPTRKMLPLEFRFRLIMAVEKFTASSAEKPEARPHVDHYLSQVFLPDIVKLEELTGLSLRSWKVAATIDPVLL